MGISASIFSSSLKTNGNSQGLLVAAEMQQLCFACHKNKSLSECFAKHIKDGTWMDRIATRIPSCFHSTQQETDYILPRQHNFEIKNELLTTSRTSFKSVFSIKEQRLMFLSAISEDFIDYGEKNVENDDSMISGQETFQSDDSYIFREEVYKVEELLLRPAMYFDEEKYTSFLTETAWIHDLPPFMDNLPVPLLILDTHSDTTEKNFTTSNIVYTNKSWEKMMKLYFEDIENKSFEEVMFCSQSEEEQLNLFSNAVESAQALKLGITCQRKNGDLFLNLMGVVPIVTDSQGTFRFVGILHCDASNEKEFDKHLSIADEIMPLLPLIIKTPNKKDELPNILSRSV